MEFLKNHYEKLILGLMLLLMAVGAVVLVLEAGSVQEDLKKYHDIALGGADKKPPAEDMGAFTNALAKAVKPPQVDFVRVHKVFNPDAWYVDTNGNLVAGTNLGLSRLTVEKILPQQLKIEFAGLGGTPGRETVAVNVTREFARTPAEQGRRRVSLSLTTTNAANTLDPVRKAQLLAREIGGTPENPEVKLELVEPGKDPIKFTLTKTQGFAMVFEYVAELAYAPDQQRWPAPQRKDAQLVFAGDTNIIVEITATNVLLRATSNDKTTSKPLAPSQPGPPGSKAP